jgi:TonB-linked SusC/RagA family outer membrane protein
MEKKRCFHGLEPCICKMIRKMKLTIFLVLFSMMGVVASESYSQTTKLTVVANQSRLEDFLKKIENQTEFRFFYSGKIDVDQKVSGNFSKRLITDVLDEILGGTGIQYEVMGRQIILSPVETGNVTSVQQQSIITGKVTGTNGEPLPGVTVLVKGTTTGTITNPDGNFSLANIPAGSSLVFSFVGMSTQEVVVGNQTVVNVVLLEETIGIEEVVAIGYGTKKRETLSGAIASIKSKDILTTRTTSLVSNLQGKIPGVQIRQQTGEPGMFNSLVSIRGFGAPLVVIDGVARDGMSDFERLNPEDVESVSILKDASAAIYGMNADNGVIIVTTKKGEKGKTKFNYTAFCGVKEATGMEQTVDAYTYRVMKNEMEKNIGNAPAFSVTELEKWKAGTELGYQNWDWIDLTLKNSTNQQQHNFSLSGGTEKISYYTSLGYTEDNGLLKSNIQQYRKYNFRNTMTAQLNKDLTAKITVAGKFDKNTSPQGSYFWAFKPILTVDRGVGPFTINNPNHLTAPPPEQNNPVALTTEKYSGYDKWSNLQYQSTLEITYNVPFLKGLSLDFLGAYDGNISNWSNLALGWYRYDFMTDALIGTGLNRLTNYSNSITLFNRKDFQAQATYKNTFGKVHNVSATVVFEARAIENHLLSGKRQYDDVYTHDIIDQGSLTNQTTGGNRSYQNYLACLGRFNYDFKGKYLFEAAFRYDGSYRYAPGKRWALFPSFSGGWRVSEEPFIKENLAFVSSLKLRGSYGNMGADAGNPFEYIAGYRMGTVDGGYVFNDGLLTMGMVPIGVTNNNLTWIKTRTANVGIDLDLWKGKLGYTMDVFQKNRDGLLGTRIQSVPNTFGASFPQENINSDLVRGIEFVLSHKNKINEFSYGITVNATYSRKYLVHTERAPYASTMEAWKDAWGSERYLGREWGYKIDGRYTSIQQYENAPLIGSTNGNARMLPGSFKVVDVNNDGIINANDQLPLFWAGQYQGYAGNPPFQFGANFNASWKNFDFNMLLQGSALFTIFTKVDDIWGYGRYPVLLTRFLDRWHTEDPNADPYDPATKWIQGRYPAIRSNYTGTSDNLTTAEWRFDAKYMRIKSLEIGYTLPKSVASRLKTESLRVYVNGFNLYTFTNKYLKNLDPEREEGSYVADLTYPLMRSFNLGINVNF